MDTKALFGGVSIGRDMSGNFKVSLAGEGIGLAIRTPDGQYYARGKDGLRNVTELTVDTFDGLVLKLPVARVKEGDILIVSDNPFTAVFVDDVSPEGQVRVLNPATNSAVDFAQPANLLGQRFFVKATNLLESFDGSNSLLPLLLLEKKDGESLLPFFLMQQLQGGDGQLNNPLLLALLLRADKGDTLETIMLLQALGGGGFDLTSATLPKTKD